MEQNASLSTPARAAGGAVIRSAALRPALLRALVCQLQSAPADRPARRQLEQRAHSLAELAGWLGGADLALRAGTALVTAEQLNAAVLYVAAALPAALAGGHAGALALVDALLELFAVVAGGDGDAMVAAAWRLRRRADGEQLAAPAGRQARPWESRQYVLLPLRGMRSPDMAVLQQPPQAQPAQQGASLAGRAPAPAPAEILHSSHADGVKLAALTPWQLQQLKVKAPGVRVMPLVRYQTSERAMLQLNPALAVPSVGAAALTLRVLRRDTGLALAGARVLAFTDLARRAGAEGCSDAAGLVRLALGGARQLEVLVAYGPSGFWGCCRRHCTPRPGSALRLAPIDLGVADLLARLYGPGAPEAGAGVSVGVIDTGVALGHPDLLVAGGAAFVQAEDDGGGHGPAAIDGAHGSHVAGIIASRGRAPAGKSGIAPGVRLFSYRVFPNGGQGATNYDIIRAIDRAVGDGCDLLNLSLGGPARDEAVREAIKDAFDQGSLCIAASGNDVRGPVSYPARWPETLAVSAIGRVGSFPAGSSEALDAEAPFAPADAALFLAGFSNIGSELDLTGPGVGIVSTVPPAGYAVMSGTSMACPAVTGCAARLLAAHPEVLALPRDRRRAIEMLRLINAAARPLGLGSNYEGLGLLA